MQSDLSPEDRAVIAALFRDTLPPTASPRRRASAAARDPAQARPASAAAATVPPLRQGQPSQFLKKQAQR
jgi:hypothetical protein